MCMNMKVSIEKWRPTVVAMVAVTTIINMVSKTSAQVPGCVTRLGTCSEITNLKSMGSSQTTHCCYDWSDEIENHKQCICDYYASSLNSMSQFFVYCDINVNPLTMCAGQGISIINVFSF